ncbi:hypothetical protein DFJ73DRAFT_783526 [Zopfochytrium polystomum]|nr:hypothetical protein DFJ73DRAFT_783526 [Zopfochytrium polystomum]
MTTAAAASAASNATVNKVSPCVGIADSSGVLLCDDGAGGTTTCKTGVTPGSICFYGGYMPDTCLTCFSPAQTLLWTRSPDTIGCHVEPDIYPSGKLYPYLLALTVAYFAANAAAFIAVPIVRRSRHARSAPAARTTATTTAPQAPALAPLTDHILAEVVPFIFTAGATGAALAILTVFVRIYSQVFFYGICALYESSATSSQVIPILALGATLFLVSLCNTCCCGAPVLRTLFTAERADDLHAWAAAWAADLKTQGGELQSGASSAGGGGGPASIPLKAVGTGGNGTPGAPFTVELEILEGRLPAPLTLVYATAMFPDGTVTDRTAMLLAASSEWKWRTGNRLAGIVGLRYIFEAVAKTRWARVRAVVRYR